MTLSVANII